MFYIFGKRFFFFFDGVRTFLKNLKSMFSRFGKCEENYFLNFYQGAINFHGLGGPLPHYFLLHKSFGLVQIRYTSNFLRLYGSAPNLHLKIIKIYNLYLYIKISNRSPLYHLHTARVYKNLQSTTFCA